MPAQSRKAVYTAAERAILDPYKEEYQRASTVSERKLVAQDVLVEIFNYWSDQGVDLYDKEERTRRLVYWMQNTWRKPKAAEAPRMILKVKPIEVLWQTRQQDVFAEIARLLGIPSADANTPGWFQKRMLAMKNILSMMSDEEAEQLERERERIGTQGYPDYIQREMAQRSGKKRLDRMSHSNWLEMGLLSISVVTRTTPQGQLGVDIHDNLAKMLGVPALPFAKLHKDLAAQMKRTIGYYVKGLLKMVNPTDGVTDDVAAPPSSRPTLEVDSTGYPKVPTSVDLTRLSKVDMEHLFRQFMSQHYYIASERRSRQAPYARMEEDLSKYVDVEHLPDRDFKITEPRNMKRGVLVAFFQHIVERQRTYDLPEVFRIKYADVGRKRRLEVRDSPDVDDGALGAAGPVAEPSPATIHNRNQSTSGTAPLAGRKPKQTRKKTKKTLNTTPNITEDAGGQSVTEVPHRPVRSKTKSKGKKFKAKATTEASGADDCGADDGRTHGDLPQDDQDDIVVPQRTKVTKKKSKTTLRTGLPVVELSIPDPPNADSHNAVPPRPRPRPKPKGKKATQTLNTSAVGVGAGGTQLDAVTAAPQQDLTPSQSAAPAPNSIDIRPGPAQGQSTVITDDLIDPVLLGMASHIGAIARPVVNTADNLALQEALQYGATGKRVPKKRY